MGPAIYLSFTYPAPCSTASCQLKITNSLNVENTVHYVFFGFQNIYTAQDYGSKIIGLKGLLITPVGKTLC